MTRHRTYRCNGFLIKFEGKGRLARPSTLDAYVNVYLHHAAMDHFPLGQAEISDLIKSVLQENVGRLEIPVNNIESPQIPESLANLPKHVQNLLLLILIAVLVAVVEKRAQISSFAVLGHNIKVAIVLNASLFTWNAS